MAKGVFIRTVTGLIPEDDEARESIKGLGQGELVMVEVSRPRNLKHHRLFWKLCSTIGDAAGVDRSDVADILKFKTGYVRQIQTKTGIIKVPRSISWAAMDQAAFNIFFDRCCNVIISEWLPGMKADDLKAEIEQMTGVNYHASRPCNVQRAGAPS